MTAEEAQARAVKGLAKGLLKTISKMGISTIPSYCGAQIFEAVGLAPELVERHFTGTASRIGGVGIDELARDTLDAPRARVSRRRATDAAAGRRASTPGVASGEHHQWNPETIALPPARGPQRAAGDATRSTPQLVNERRGAPVDAARPAAVPLRRRTAAIPLDEVEPAGEIVKRFATGAMSLGSLSREAHETLAIAMNRIGGRSNTGEGGEDPVRFTPRRERRLARARRSSRSPRAASASTIDYLVERRRAADQDGAGREARRGRPAARAQGRRLHRAASGCTTPGVGLISPPPHHDIYSIEDLKQLIYDLRCANPKARDLREARRRGRRRHRRRRRREGERRPRADLGPRRRHRRLAALVDPVTPGSRGRSGSPRRSRRSCCNDLRSRIWVQTDGQLKTGRDVVVAALLGADEMGFATAPLIATGCVMMRACHLNTCPVGIATQDPELRKRFTGQPEHVVNFFFFVAEEARRLMARLGVRRFEELVGRVDLLEADDAIEHWKARGIDLSSALLASPRRIRGHAGRAASARRTRRSPTRSTGS